MARNPLEAAASPTVLALDLASPLEDLPCLQAIDLVLAADIIYDDAITDLFVAFLGRLGRVVGRAVRVMVALERRVVFTLEELEARAPAYEHLLARLAAMEGLEVARVAIDWPQNLCYQRCAELELIELTLL